MYNLTAHARALRQQPRQDDWISTLGGLGGRTDRGRAAVTYLSRNNFRLTDEELSTAYEQLWLVRKIVEAPACEALRRGWGEPEGADLSRFLELNYGGAHDEGAFERACHMAELKGGAGLFIGYREANPEALLEPAREGTEVEFLEVFDRYQLTGQQRKTGQEFAADPDFGRPQIWSVTNSANRAGMRFHTSRMIKFPGAPRARDLGVTQDDRDWGDSRLQAIWTDIQRYGVFWQTVGHLLQISSVGVLELKGVIQLLASKNQADVEARIDLLNQVISNTKVMLLDAGQQEKYHREAVSFADVPQLLDRLEVATAAAVGRPVAVLFGRAPAGLNATGESDIRLWYADVEGYRKRVIEPRLERVVAACEGRAIDIEFEPLWSPTEKEQAEVRQIETAADERGWTMGVWSADELRQARQEGKWPEEMSFGPKAPVVEKPEPTTTQTEPDEMQGKMQGEMPRADAMPRYQIGERVRATVAHDEGMLGATGAISIARMGDPPYYGVLFDGQTETHKWLAEDELAPAGDARQPMQMEDAKAPVINVTVQAPAQTTPIPTAAEVADELERRHTPSSD